MDASNYSKGSKNNARSRHWNLIDQMRDRDSAGAVLYLPGENDLDRAVAKRHGYDDADLIAVEINRHLCRKLRNRKVTCIRGGLADVMENWPVNRPVQLVVADLQCGFTSEAQRIVRAYITNPCFAKGILSINLQRGREKTGTGEKDPWVVALNEGRYQRCGFLEDEMLWQGIKEQRLHRARSVLGFVESYFASELAEMCRRLDEADSYIRMVTDRIRLSGNPPSDTTRFLMDYHIQVLSDARNFIRTSPIPAYVSGRVKMDGCVLKVRRPSWCSVTESAYRRSAREIGILNPKVSAVISAALAIRTMRVNGKLGRSMWRPKPSESDASDNPL